MRRSYRDRQRLAALLRWDGERRPRPKVTLPELKFILSQMPPAESAEPSESIPRFTLPWRRAPRSTLITAWSFGR